jgi:hypothetical protein
MKDQTMAGTTPLVDQLREAVAGATLEMRVKRADETMEVQIRPEKATRKVWKAIPVDDAGKKKLREGWYYAGKKPVSK